MKIVYSTGLALAAGILLAFAYPNLYGNGFFPLAVLAFSFYYFQLIKTEYLKIMLLQTFAFSLGFSATGFYWIPQTLSTFGEIDLYLGYIVSVFFALIVLPYLWPQILIIYYLKKKKLPTATFLLILCCSHVTLEQFTPAQFPVWLGHSMLSNNTLLPLTSYFGAGIYSFAMMLLVLYLPQLFKKNFNCLKLLFLGSFILIFDYLLGLNTHYLNATTDTSVNNFKVRVVQANIGNFMKISSEKGEENSVLAVYNQYQQLSFQAPLDFNLLIWPETAVPTLFNTSNWKHENLANYPFMQKIISQLPAHAAFVFGGYDDGHLEQSQNSAHNEFNTAFFYQDFNLQTYYKIKLIPFGETLPFGNLNQKVSIFFPGVSLFSQGSRFNFFSLNNQTHFITPICYELLDTTFMRIFLNSHENIDFIVNLSNDSWYGNTAQPWQHLFLARWRALEFRKPIIRSTNTGITTVIDEYGKFTNYLAVGDKNILDVNLNLHPHAKTIYQQLGILPLFLFMIITFLFYLVSPALIKSWRRRTPNNS